MYGHGMTKTSNLVDGLCTIDVVVQDQSVRGVASYAELGIAASNLVGQCAVARGVGGIAMNVGMCSYRMIQFNPLSAHQDAPVALVR